MGTDDHEMAAEASRREWVEGEIKELVSDLRARVQFLVDYMDSLDLLEEHCFAFPDGETWWAKNLCCASCQGRIRWVDAPTGGWWAHEQHPTDDHDAVKGAT